MNGNTEKAELMKSLYEIGAIKFGEFVLKSKKTSPYYIDLRILPSYPSVLEEVGEVMGEMITSSPKKPTRLCGIPAAGLAITNAIGLETMVPVFYTRKEPTVYKDMANHLRKVLEDKKKAPMVFVLGGRKRREAFKGGYYSGFDDAIRIIDDLSGLKAHGIKRYVDGEIENGDKIGIVDDLITTAGSKLEARDLVNLEVEKRKLKNVDIVGVYVLLDREQGGKESLEKEGLKLHSVATIREAATWLHDLGVLKTEMYNTIVDYTIAQRKEMGLED